MIVEGEFFFDGVARWNLGWATPNYAGAFLVTILCFLWAIRARWWLMLGLALELALYFLVSKTYSRGAAVALGAGAAFFVIFVYGGHRSLNRILVSGRLWSLRFGLASACAVLTGFVGRLDPSRVVSDEGVTNRLDLWRGSLEMIASSPAHGWGAGESGRAYMNWFQPLDEQDIYTTTVNSYLHIAVEYGLPVLAMVLTLATAILIVAGRGARHDAWTGAAGASLVVWMVANVFTTLWIEPLLWIVPVAAVAMIVMRSLAARTSPRMWRRTLLWSGSGAVGLSAGLYLAGTMLMQSHPFRVVPTEDGVVTVSVDADGMAQRAWHVWPDPVVFGPTPGKELRRWLIESATSDIALHVHGPTPTALRDIGDSGSSIVLSGRHVERLRESVPANVEQLWLIHPSSPPPSVSSGAKTVLVLPDIDETGLGDPWMGWARRTEAQLRISPGCGLDVRTAWPRMAPNAERT